MLKKLTGLLLALTMALALAACAGGAGQDEPAGSQEPPAAQTAQEQEPSAAPTEEPGWQPEKKLSQLVAEKGPKDRSEELTFALELCREQVDQAVAAAEQAGLSEDETLKEMFEFWDSEVTFLGEYNQEYMENVEGDVNDPEVEEDFLELIARTARIYNMARGVARDPALWLKHNDLYSQSQAESSDPNAAPETVETGGAWPQGLYFSDRMPAMETVDSLMSMTTGEEYGFENGKEYLLYVYSMDEETARTYLDRLVEAGFREESKEELYGAFMWFGRLDDGEGHISLAMIYNANAAGTERQPALTVQIYNYDIVGMLIDLGQISVY